ncbi:LytR family transcriptional regulator, partial [Mycobacterium tuberculosis]
MSDGESAAPWARLSESAFPDGVDRWITVPPATWVAAQGPRDTQNVGCHATGAVSVADLIARLGPAFPDLPTHRHVAPEPEPSGRGPKVHDDADDQQDTEAIAIPAHSLEFLSELPDLRAANYPRADHARREPELPGKQLTGSARVRPLRIRRTSPAPAKPAPNSGRRPMVLAARSLAALFAALALALTGGAWQWSASKNSRLNMVSALDPHSG